MFKKKPFELSNQNIALYWRKKLEDEQREIKKKEDIKNFFRQLYEFEKTLNDLIDEEIIK